jgi:hypothetical protein
MVGIHLLRIIGDGRVVGWSFIGDGYVWIRMPNHPRADKNGYMQEHIVIKEKEIGRYL